MRTYITAKRILLLFSLLFLILGNRLEAHAECALVLTSPLDGAVFTGTSGQITIYGYVKAEVDPGYGYIELTNNNQYIQRWEGTFTSANYVFQNGAVTLTLDQGANHIVVEGDADGCSGKASDEITVYYEPDAETGPDDELGLNPGKGDGPPKCQNNAGDPVNIATGNVTVQTTDFSATVPGVHSALHLKFERSYNSQTSYTGSLGHGWTHNYNLAVIPGDAGGLVGVRRPGGQVLYFKDTGNGTFSAPKGVHNKLTLVNGQYLFTTTENIIYTFSDKGYLLLISDLHGNSLIMQRNSTDFPEQLSGVIDDFGRSLQFEYNYNSGLLSKMIDPASREYLYTPDANGNRNLVAVTYPSDGDPEIIQYEYNDSADIHNLTLITDENSHTYTYGYDANDRAVLSTGQDNARRIDIDYSGNDSIVVTNSRGYKTIYSRIIQDEVGYITGITAAAESGGSCNTCAAIGSYEYDAAHTLRSRTNARGIATRYTYDDRGNMFSVLEAAGTDEERLTEYTPHAVFNKPEFITAQSVDTESVNRVTQIVYDPVTSLPLSIAVNGYVDGQLETRTTTFTEYTDRGQLKKVDGSRTDVLDVTNYQYYPDNDTDIYNRGMLHKVVNALDQTTEFDNYNHFGRPELTRDVNNVETVLQYDPRGRLIEETINGKTTGYVYDKAGNLETITPHGSKGITIFSYTTANLMEYVYDQLGNYLKRSYDTESNLQSEYHYTSGDVARRYLEYETNSFNQLNRIINPDQTFTLLEPDENGNLTGLTDAMDRKTGFVYDELDRLETRTQPDTIITRFEYDSQGNPSRTTDPENTVTEYLHDDFGGLQTVTSQDSGIVNYDHDLAGNLESATDANSITVHYDHDVLNRLSTISYTPLDQTQNIGFVYDESAAVYGTGRLTSTIDAGGATSYQYNAFGLVIQESRSIDTTTYTTGYTYNDRNNLEILTYPTGAQVTFQRYDNEQVSGILIDGQVLTQGVTYLPLGPEEDFVFGSNVFTVDRKYYDNYFRLESITTPTLNFQYQYYANDQVKSIDGVTVPSVSKGRTEYVTKIGNNRLDYVTRPDSSAHNYTHDNNGNITTDGVFNYRYTQLNRLIEVKQGTAIIAEYVYDPFGRRIKKSVSGRITHFHYDRQGNLISETSGNGIPLRDYVYQNGNLVAIKLHGNQAGVYYVINDHLGTPQQIVDSSGAIVWKASYLPFGEAQILVATISNNIRFPGQYFDEETGLHYNWHRYYDPSTGRYLTPDPVGLAGGINLYAYVLNDPVNWYDPNGSVRKNNKGDGSATGKNTSKPYKHCKQHPTKPNMLQCKDKRTGKKKTVPKPPGWDDNNQKNAVCDGECKKVATTVVAAGGITYIVYRCARMTPSLFPPLWWTIPGNALAP